MYLFSDCGVLLGCMDRIYRHFSTIEHLSNEKKPGPGVLMKMMQNRYDIENGLHPTISCKCLNLLSQEYKYKTPEGEIVFARNVHVRTQVFELRVLVELHFRNGHSAGFPILCTTFTTSKKLRLSFCVYFSFTSSYVQ